MVLAAEKAPTPSILRETGEMLATVGGPVDADLVLDACVVLNLYATGQIEQILAAQGRRIIVVERAVEEAIWVGEVDGNGAPIAPERVELSGLVARGVLEVVGVDGVEALERFVEFAVELDDGEAASATVALLGGGVLATDDRKAIHIASGRRPPVKTCSTSQVMLRWAEATNVDPVRLRQALLAIERRATFRPGKQDPLFEWWRSAVLGNATDAA